MRVAPPPTTSLLALRFVQSPTSTEHRVALGSEPELPTAPIAETLGDSATPPRTAKWIDRFELAPSSAGIIPELDGLRSVAVIFIFLRHSWGLSGQPNVAFTLPFIGQLDLSPLIVMMANGVDLFFVLSGYLLCRAFVAADLRGDAPPSLRKYARSRAFRILPAYYFALAALILLFAPMLLASEDVYSLQGLTTGVSHALVAQTVNPVSYGRWGIASPYWTLTIEVIFYALVPFTARFFFRRRAPWALAASLVVTLAWLWIARYSGGSFMNFVARNSHRSGAGAEFARFWFSKQIPGYAFSFGVGMAVASLTEQARHATRSGETAPWHGRRWVGIATLALGTAIIVASMFTLGRLTLDHTFYDGIKLMSNNSRSALGFYFLETTSMALGFGLIVHGVVTCRGTRATAPFRLNGFRLIGILGFAIYLWHMPLLYLYNHVGPISTLPPGWHWFWLGLAAGFATLTIGIFSFFVIEKPFVQRGRRSPATTTKGSR